MKYHLIYLSLYLITAHPIFANDITLENNKEFPAKSKSENQILHIIGATDLQIMSPLVDKFQQNYPNVTVKYAQASSKNVYRAIIEEKENIYDLAISSGMDLQLKLVNDGFTKNYQSSATSTLPHFMKWQNNLFGFALEEVSIIYNQQLLNKESLPKTRFKLLEYMREHPNKFKNKITTYDINNSGAGYLFATQDSLRSKTFWRLMEVFGTLNTQLSCCSYDMIDNVSKGKAVLAYNIVGSYIKKQIDQHQNLNILKMQDYNLMMIRSVLMNKKANNITDAGHFIDFLIDEFNQNKSDLGKSDIPIQLNLGLLVYQDKFKHRNFLNEWNSALKQNQ